MRVHSPRLAASSSYRRMPVSRGPDWIPCQARNDGREQETIPRGLPRGSSFRAERDTCTISDLCGSQSGARWQLAHRAPAKSARLWMSRMVQHGKCATSECAVFPIRAGSLRFLSHALRRRKLIQGSKSDTVLCRIRPLTIGGGTGLDWTPRDAWREVRLILKGGGCENQCTGPAL